MAEIFSGFICGFGLSLLSAPLLALTLLRMRVTSPVLARLLPPDVSPVGLMLTIHFALLFFWTAIGIILGMLLLAMDGNAAALGSANGPFTLIVASLVTMVVAPFAFIIVSWRRYILGVALVVIAVFGWLMPHMANWTKFD